MFGKEFEKLTKDYTSKLEIYRAAQVRQEKARQELATAESASSNAGWQVECVQRALFAHLGFYPRSK